MSKEQTTTELKVVDVLCDSAARLGPLSYLVPANLSVSAGDAVEVPFGKRTTRGVVLGPGDPARATRAILAVYGVRAHPEEIELAHRLAEMNLCDFTTIASRLAPTTKRGNPPITPGPVILSSGPTFSALARPPKAKDLPRRLEICAPGVDQTRLAALEAFSMSKEGQILILCPTKQLVSATLAQFSSGAARLDQPPKGDDPSPWKAFVDGSLPVGIATRSGALWSAPNLAAIIVVDEDHPGHREAAQPHTNARDVAAARTALRGIKLVLLSTNPSPSALGAKVKIAVVGQDEHWPTMSIHQRAPRRRHDMILPPGLDAVMNKAIQNKETPVVVAGSARSRRRCGTCSHSFVCEICDTGSCEHVASANCPKCQAPCRTLGWDVTRTQKACGPSVKVVTAAELRKMKSADLVVLFDIDPLLNAAELVPERAAASLILDAARIAMGGHLAVVTSDKESPTISALVEKRNLLALAKRTWESSKQAGLPPFGRQITVSIAGKAPNTSHWPGRIFGPRSTGENQWEIMVLCSDKDLPVMGDIVRRLRRTRQMRVTVT